MKTFNKERKIVEKLKWAIYKTSYNSSANCPRLTSLVPNKCLDIAILCHDRKCKSFYDYILEY